MTLRALLEDAGVMGARGDLDVEVTGLALDSRRVRPGDAFFALPGTKDDGGRFVQAAIASGAVAVVAGTDVTVGAVPAARVADPRLALAKASCRLHDHPSRALRVVAVTGTNGKTTTSTMVEAIFVAAGWTTGLIGTTGIRIAGESRASAFTTPESPELQALLAEMRARGVRGVAMEASSHALHQRRTWGLACDVAVFTNLTQDHLDYHGTMASYLDAKLMLFDGRNGGTGKDATAVINADDPSAERVADAARLGGMRVLAYGTAAGAPAPALTIERIDATSHGLGLALRDAGGVTELRLPMLGRFNAWNAAAAWAAAAALGIPAGVAKRALESFEGVGGRLERIVAGQRFGLVVDYAHTPDALERALAACREHARGRVLVVFGCGGDRDRAKRPRMGAIAAAGAALAWITNDNPRGESPAAIAQDIAAGAPGHPFRVELDRRAAIGAAIDEAREGDIVLVAGKGHETTQTIGDRVTPFDDRVVAREALAIRGAGA